MQWIRRVGWILLAGGLVCAILTFNASGTKSRLREEARYAWDTANRSKSPEDKRKLELAEAQAKEAEATHGQWLMLMFGGVGAGMVCLAASFIASRLSRGRSATQTPQDPAEPKTDRS